MKHLSIMKQGTKLFEVETIFPINFDNIKGTLLEYHTTHNNTLYAAELDSKQI